MSIYTDTSPSKIIYNFLLREIYYIVKFPKSYIVVVVITGFVFDTLRPFVFVFYVKEFFNFLTIMSGFGLLGLEPITFVSEFCLVHVTECLY